jgi:tagatose 6-phosphate kinase
MILTVTMNPSVDIAYKLDKLVLDDINRCDGVFKTAGGKGLNVTRVIKLLGGDVTATGVIGGAAGDFIKNRLNAMGIKNDFLQTDKESRNCIAVLHEGMQTEILESGPVLSMDEEQAFLVKFKSLLKGVSLVTISGSLPRGLDADYYAKLIEIADEYNIPVLLDSSGASLKAALEGKVKPFLIKPNRTELAQLEGRPSENYEDLKKTLEGGLYKGVRWVVISMGSKGAFVKHLGKYYSAQIPEVEVVSPVGSGDSTVAGLAHAISKGLPPEEIIKTAMTAGILNAMQAKTGFIDMADFDKYYEQIKVKEI